MRGLRSRRWWCSWNRGRHDAGFVWNLVRADKGKEKKIKDKM